MEAEILKTKRTKKSSVNKKIKSVKEEPLKPNPSASSGRENPKKFFAETICNAVCRKEHHFLKTAIIFVAVLLVIIGSVYFLNRTGYINFPVKDQQVLTRLKTIILLPDNPAPSMAVVANADVLKKEQPQFFANAKNGDRLIIYPDLVILYDYNANKIIKVGPVQTAKNQ